MGYRIGIDVGDRSVGLAAVEYDADGQALRVLTRWVCDGPHLKGLPKVFVVHVSVF